MSAEAALGSPGRCRISTLPHFYFHVWREGQLVPDEVGLSLPTLGAAKRRADSMASSITGQSDGAWSRSGWDIEVTDHTGGTVLIVPISGLQQNMKRKQAA